MRARSGLQLARRDQPGQGALARQDASMVVDLAQMIRQVARQVDEELTRRQARAGDLERVLPVQGVRV